jgi:hypothetical protein
MAINVMKRAVLASLFAVAMLFASSSVSAQDNADAPAADTGDKKVKTYDFTGDEIDGELIKPDGDFIDTRGTADFGSLISIRQDFIKEILKSAEDL